MRRPSPPVVREIKKVELPEVKDTPEMKKIKQEKVETTKGPSLYGFYEKFFNPNKPQPSEKYEHPNYKVQQEQLRQAIVKRPPLNYIEKVQPVKPIEKMQPVMTHIEQPRIKKVIPEVQPQSTKNLNT